MPKFFTKAKPKTTVIAGNNDTLTSKIGFCYVNPPNRFRLIVSGKLIFFIKICVFYITYPLYMGKDVQYEFFCNQHQKQGDKKEKSSDQKM